MGEITHEGNQSSDYWMTGDTNVLSHEVMNHFLTLIKGIMLKLEPPKD